jgi:hypothetical protein
MDFYAQEEKQRTKLKLDHVLACWLWHRGGICSRFLQGAVPVLGSTQETTRPSLYQHVCHVHKILRFTIIALTTYY